MMYEPNYFILVFFLLGIVWEDHYRLRVDSHFNLHLFEMSKVSSSTLKTSKYFVGAHTSILGGMFKAAEEAHQNGAKGFALFIGNQRSWKKKSLETSEIEQFKSTCQKLNFDPKFILPHGSYLINLANPDEEKRMKSLEKFIYELQECENLGLNLYNFHPGSCLGSDIKSSIKLVSDSINLAHQKTRQIITVIENTAGQGNTLGYSLEQLKDILMGVKDQSRVGICLDTCHLFAAGYDLRTKSKYEQFFQTFEKMIGFQYLKAFHLNDSKGELNSNLDRHENIGKGQIGMECFRLIMNDPRLQNIPVPIFNSFRIFSVDFVVNS